MNTRLAAERRSEADLKAIARRQKDFVAAVRSGEYPAMSAANKRFHMAIAQAGRTPYSRPSTNVSSTGEAGCCTCISAISTGAMKDTS